MEMDAATRSFLAMLRDSGGKPLHEQELGEARTAVRALSQQLGGPLVEVHQVSEREIPGEGGEFAVRIYWPRAPANGAPLPIVLHYHGGGFVAGDLDSHDNMARYYCRHADALVVNVGYRLAPEHKFPAPVEDSYAALCWAYEHARELGADPDRIAVTGDSAGGNLSAVVCQMAKTQRGPHVAFQALLYPGTDFDSASTYPSREQFGGGEYFLSTKDMHWFASMYLGDVARDGKDPRASPILTRDLTGLPPALVVTCGFDVLRDEGKAYADRLAGAGVPVEYQCFENTIHACASFRSVIPAGEQLMSLVARRLREALHG
jgi:acetyl esterase